MVLRASLLTLEIHDEIRVSFECGTTEFALRASEWICGQGCWDSTRKFGTKVYVFRDSDTGKTVGYGSVGTTKKKLSNASVFASTVAIIPMIAVCLEFQSTVNPDTGRNYSVDIMAFLIQKAAVLDCDLLILYVDMSNEKAVALYEKMGFQKTEIPARESYIAMAKRIR